MYPIGWGSYNLDGYGYLQPVIYYFSSANARDGNSFANISLAANNQWTTASVLDPALANTPIGGSTYCQPGETPLECEYRVVKPSVALILLGTNDLHTRGVGEFRANLERIVQITIDRGIIPVLSTIPNRPGYDVNAYNQAIRGVAGAFDIPLWDYYGAMAGAPNSGLSADNMHPSNAPRDYSASADFRAENLIYGYTIRNLTALMVLDAVWRAALG
jgi:hypothetical protein